MNDPKQLIFPWIRANKSSLDNFYFESENLQVKDTFNSGADFLIYGEQECGKSFLLQSFCNQYAADKKSSLYVPLKEVLIHGTSFLDSIDTLELVCIDNIDAISNRKEWEIAIFNLINNCMLSNCRLIFSSSLNPAKLNFDLNDLKSRIKKIEPVKVLPISDQGLEDALSFVANKRLINLGEKEVQYIITHCNRSMKGLLNVLDRIDQVSAELKRKITIPLIKKVI